MRAAPRGVVHTSVPRAGVPACPTWCRHVTRCGTRDGVGDVLASVEVARVAPGLDAPGGPRAPQGSARCARRCAPLTRPGGSPLQHLPERRGATVAPRPANARVRRPRRSGGVCPELEHALDTHPAERLRADAERTPGPPPVGLLRNASLAKILADAPVDRPRSWPVGSTAGPSGGYGDGGGGNGATLGEG